MSKSVKQKMNDHGYIDITNDQLKNLNIFFGGRGIGKTFSILKHRCQDAISDPNKKFIWLRDSGEVVKKIAAGNSLTRPIELSDPLFPHIVIERISGNYCFVVTSEDNDNKVVIGYLMALSTFHNARGISYEDVSCIVWDEFIPEEGTIVKKNQGAIFLNMYESVCRNREFDGLDPVRIIFLSNTNDIYSDVLADLGVSSIIEQMQYDRQTNYEDNDILIRFLSSKEFYEKKKDTFIYRINQNNKFQSMALDNNFNNSMQLIKRTVNLKGSKGLFTLDMAYTLIELPDQTLYFKKCCWKNLINYDMDNDQEAILFRMIFYDKLRLIYISGNMYFDSIYTQRKILDYARF